MLKPDSIAKALAGAIPDLSTDPDRFQAYVSRGRVVARGTPGLGFEYRYQLDLFLLAYEGHPDAVFWPLLQWMRVNQPEQFLNDQLRDDAIRFDVDILDGRKCNISIEIQLSESVIATGDDKGGFTLEHIEEPDFGDGEPLGILHEIWGEHQPPAPERIVPLPE